MGLKKKEPQKKKKKKMVKKMMVKKPTKIEKKMVGKKVLGTYLLVATELLFGLGVNRLKWPEMELIFF